MSYVPPTNDAVNLTGTLGYFSPSNDNVQLSPKSLINESVLVTGSSNSSVTEVTTAIESVNIVRQTYSSAPNDAVVLSGTSGYSLSSNDNVDLSPLPGTEGVGVNIDTQETTVAQEQTTVVGSSSVDAVVRGFADESMSVTPNVSVPTIGDVGIATDQLRVSVTTGTSLVEKVILLESAIEITGVIGVISFEESASGAVALEQSASGGVGLEQSASGTADIEEAATGDTDNSEDS